MGLDLNLFYKLVGKRPRYVTSGPRILFYPNRMLITWPTLLSVKRSLRVLSLNAGVRNLFDVSRINSSFVQGGIHTGGGLNVGTGRSYFATLAFNWNKK